MPCGIKYYPSQNLPAGDYVFKFGTGFWSDTNGHPASSISIVGIKADNTEVELYRKDSISNNYNQNFTSGVVSTTQDYNAIYFRVNSRHSSYVSLGNCSAHKVHYFMDEGSIWVKSQNEVYIWQNGEWVDFLDVCLGLANMTNGDISSIVNHPYNRIISDLELEFGKIYQVHFAKSVKLNLPKTTQKALDQILLKFTLENGSVSLTLPPNIVWNNEAEPEFDTEKINRFIFDTTDSARTYTGFFGMINVI
jgi:hypothetical protein